MAARAKSICRKVACGALIDAPGYCARHAQQAVGWNRSHGDKSSTERGYGATWQKTRKAVLSRDKGLCRIKGPTCTYVAREVDHKVSKARGRQLGWTDAQVEDESNLQSACVACHKRKTAEEKSTGM